MLQNQEIDASQFIQFTNSGIVVASFVQVRDALITQYKLTYGNDIDLSTNNADGVFVNNLALIINNILQAFKSLYANLNVNTASGKYLDNLCALSNVRRKPASNSTASLNVTNKGSSEYNQINPIFIDKSGVEWVYSGTLTLSPNETQSIIVTCREEGPIKADAGWIDKTLELSYLTVKQENAANLGKNEESDSSLRARRSLSSAANGITVLEGISGGLLALSGIRDVKIYNNNTSSAKTAADGTSYLAHSIYVILRYEENVLVDEQTICDIIYRKLTPGILTTASNNVQGTNISKDYIPTLEGQSLTAFSNTINWKKATPVNPKIDITITELDYFDINKMVDIGKAVIDYLNNLQLSTDLTAQNILIQTTYADPLFLGKNTYIVTNVAITGGTDGTYSNQDTYYNYTNAVYSNGVLTIT